MSSVVLHKTQVSILHSLRYAPSARFNTLMRPTGHTSDTFKFHLRKLLSQGLVEKTSAGTYVLTAKGKEFANNLDEQQRMEQKQPKLSVLIVAPRTDADGRTSYLLQKRARNPYLGYWNEITGPVRWGDSFEDAAAKVLLKQTGLQADFRVRGMRRIRDYAADSNALLEDKVFVIIEATKLYGELQNKYAGGTNDWLTLAELTAQEKYFASTPAIVGDLAEDSWYATQDIRYQKGDY
ncbi:MAG TPA: NUDIX domain-containing protein [Candidatus Saccharimonadales bacterium]|nr:NUDIX domain-containing protein [Candidatus Saccharimonadales bacterium]